MGAYSESARDLFIGTASVAYASYVPHAYVWTSSLLLSFVLKAD